MSVLDYKHNFEKIICPKMNNIPKDIGLENRTSNETVNQRSQTKKKNWRRYKTFPNIIQEILLIYILPKDRLEN